MRFSSRFRPSPERAVVTDPVRRSRRRSSDVGNLHVMRTSCRRYPETLPSVCRLRRRSALLPPSFEVCSHRPDPIVRVAAAAAGFEITAEPARLIAILAKGTRDRDPLVRDLAATALARVNPEHSALRRLAPRSRRGTSKGRAHTSLLVHGTFARNEPWWQPGGDFHSYLLANVLPESLYWWRSLRLVGRLQRRRSDLRRQISRRGSVITASRTP